MKKYFILVIVIALFTTTLKAQTQAEMNAKALKDYEKVDKELNLVYKELLKILDDNEKKLLINAQKDWIKFRDSHCEFEAIEYEGGSIQPLIKLTCLKDQTEKRIEDLNFSIGRRK